jgi:hypothetical protein
MMYPQTPPNMFSSSHSSLILIDSFPETPIKIDLPIRTPTTGSTCSDYQDISVSPSPSPEIISAASSSRLLGFKSNSSLSLLPALSSRSASSTHSGSVPSSLWCGGGSFVQLLRSNLSIVNKTESPADYSPATLRIFVPQPLDASDLTRRLESLAAERHEKLKEMVNRIIGGVNKDSNNEILAMITKLKSGEEEWTKEEWKERMDELFREKEGIVMAVIDAADEWMADGRERVNVKPTARELTGRFWGAMFS